MTERIDIAFGADASYAPHVAAAIASVVSGAADVRLRFIILHDGIARERQAMVETVAPGADFCWVAIGDGDVPPYMPPNSHFSRANLYRLGLEKLAPDDCRRVLYLDSDVIVLGDVREICTSDLGSFSLAAISDGYYLDGSEFARFWGLAPSALGYFNSGVMLIDLERVRKERLFSAAIDLFAREDSSRFRFADQCALNVVAWDRWRQLPPRWNAQRDMVIPAIAEHLPPHMRFHNRLPDLVHYTGPQKPWNMQGYHPWSWLYWRHLAQTPLFDEVVARHHVGRLARARLWLRWLRRRPPRLRMASPIESARP